MKLVLLWTVAWAVVVMALSPIVNYVTPFLSSSYNEALTPDFFYRLVVYWHAGIFEPWVVVLSVLVYLFFGLDKLSGFVGKGLRFVIYLGAYVGVPLSGIAGVFNVSSDFAYGIPHWAESGGFAFMDLLAIGLIVGMIAYPYASHRGLTHMGAPYYVVLLGVFGAFAAALMGYVGAYLTAFGASPALVSNYVNSTIYPVTGFYNSTAVSIYTEGALTSHSHAMLPVLMAGVVALVAAGYGYQTWTKGEKTIAQFGFIVMGISVVVVVWLYWAAGVGNFPVPTYFVSGPNGINGIAGDDIVTGVVGLGALFVLIPLMMHAAKSRTAGGKPFLRDSLFLAVLAAWVMIYVIIPVGGYYIELHHDFFRGAGIRFTEAFSRFHQDFAFFLLPALITTVLIFESFGLSGSSRRTTGYLYLVGEVITFVFGGIYTLVDLNPAYLYIATLGGLLMGLGVISGLNFLRKAGTVRAAAT